MDLEAMLTDGQLEENGVWVDIGDEAQLLVASISNQKLTKMRQTMLDRSVGHMKRRLQASLGDASSEETIKILSQTVLLGWKNLNLGGKPLPYNAENCAMVLKDHRYIRDIVLELASTIETFKKADMEENKALLGES